MLPWLGCANPSSPHALGRAAREALEAARDSLASYFGLEAIFTSGGTEANVLALTGLADSAVTSVIEHPSVLETVSGTWTCDGYGRVSPGEFAAGLVSIQAANNEVGTLQPIVEMARAVRARGGLFHTDAVQAVGKVDLPWREFDAVSVSAHKFGGPQGVGALLVREGLEVRPLLPGGGQEEGRRSGTPNVAGIVGMAAALRAYRPPAPDLGAPLLALGRLTGHPVERLPGHYSFVFDDVGGESLVMLLESRGLCASTGSACSTEKAQPSHVLTAMGLPARGSLRLTLGPRTTRAEVERAADIIAECVEELRRRAPGSSHRGDGRGSSCV